MQAPKLYCMQAPAQITKPKINIAFLNMEHSSHKSYVADVTTTGADVIQHKERLLGRG